jgi:hypothetical protein
MGDRNPLPVLLNSANAAFPYRIYLPQEHVYDQIEMAKTAERNFRQYSAIKTILADFLDHPTSQTGADALRAFAWLSP